MPVLLFDVGYSIYIERKINSVVGKIRGFKLGFNDSDTEPEACFEV